MSPETIQGKAEKLQS